MLTRKDKKRSFTLLQSSQIGNLIHFKLSAGKSSLSRLVQCSLNPQAPAARTVGRLRVRSRRHPRAGGGGLLAAETPRGLNMFVFTRTCMKRSWRKGIVGSFPAQENPAWLLPHRQGDGSLAPTPPTPLSSLMGCIFILSQHIYFYLCE